MTVSQCSFLNALSSASLKARYISVIGALLDDQIFSLGRFVVKQLKGWYVSQSIEISPNFFVLSTTELPIQGPLLPVLRRPSI